ncbi:glycosyltransferase family 2 protein [Pseudooceanicola nanhaiensis]|uniref:glycosyltransferase family 2 protein n=1 Tax=Pseudooceanicola nanhaiensis TaxID=375761 RepID=UPI001CD4E69C|nr:glycosyltransferase family 2 protein [Pseudooceanicola nanhaiensis]MCA0921001.1 glycosyltransferase family 2 protein [Pseudooceanicola nanhaiensis]
MRITAATCVKNEGPFLLEWIAYNRAIGVTDFLFYSNDCDDGTDALLDVLAAGGVVQHLPNPAEGRNYQMEALKDAKRQPVITQADWVWVADVDEFLNIHVGDNTIPALIAACDDPKAISIQFQFFGNGGVDEYRDQPVIGQFLQSHDPDVWCGQLAIECKTLVRKDFPLQYFGAHRPFFRDKGPRKRPRWSDASGRPVPQAFLLAENERRIRRFPAKGARDFATLNHYALRSLDSYIVKTERGDVNREGRNFEDAYWRERADVAWKDDSILRMMPRLTEEFGRLAQVPGVAEAHQACVHAHRAKVARLMEDPFYRDLRRALHDAPTISQPEEVLLTHLGLDWREVVNG